MQKSQKKLKGYSAYLVKTLVSAFLVAVFLLSLPACAAKKENLTMTLATTTSVNDSGLLEYLRPYWEEETGITVKIVAQGTGQAIKTGENKDADMLLIHDKKSEDKFVQDGFGVERIPLMYNYFVLAGPKEDPAGLKKIRGQDAAMGLKQIMDQKVGFVSRGDDSGTHKKELSLWKSIDITPSGSWYIAAGKGMGDVLMMASEKRYYTLCDKATFLSMKDKLDLTIVLENAKDLFNQYSVIAVNKDKDSKINHEAAEKFIQWITSDKALSKINEYGKDKYGESLFVTNFEK